MNLTYKLFILFLLIPIYGISARSSFSKDRMQTPSIILSPNIMNGVNVLSQSMLKNENVIYVVQHDFDLQNNKITVPSNCTLDFQGGRFVNGELIGNHTRIMAGQSLIFKTITLSGTWNVENVYSTWFDFVTDDEKVDNSANFHNLSAMCSDTSQNNIYIKKGTYYAQIKNGKLIENVYPEGRCLIELKSNTQLFNDGTIMLTGCELQRYAILYMFEKESININGGVYIGDVDTHKGTKGEWGYGVFVRSSQNITINHVNISKCWGDGIVIGGLSHNQMHASTNIIIKNSIFDNNRRQGCSITYAKDVFIDNCVFKNTGMTYYTAPGAGIDLEPDRKTTANENIHITNCFFEQNKGFGIQVHGANKKINISSCQNQSSKNGGLLINMHYSDDDSYVNVSNCNLGAGIMLFGGKINLNNCYWGGTVLGKSTFDFPLRVDIYKCRLGSPYDTMTYFKYLFKHSKPSIDYFNVRNSVLKLGNTTNVLSINNPISPNERITIDNCTIDANNKILQIYSSLNIKGCTIKNTRQIFFNLNGYVAGPIEFINNNIYYSNAAERCLVMINPLAKEVDYNPVLSIVDCNFYPTRLIDEHAIQSFTKSIYNNYIIRGVHFEGKNAKIIELNVKNRLNVKSRFR